MIIFNVKQVICISPKSNLHAPRVVSGLTTSEHAPAPPPPVLACIMHAIAIAIVALVAAAAASTTSGCSKTKNVLLSLVDSFVLPRGRVPVAFSRARHCDIARRRIGDISIRLTGALDRRRRLAQHQRACRRSHFKHSTEESIRTVAFGAQRRARRGDDDALPFVQCSDRLHWHACAGANVSRRPVCCDFQRQWL